MKLGLRFHLSFDSTFDFIKLLNFSFSLNYERVEYLLQEFLLKSNQTC